MVKIGSILLNLNLVYKNFFSTWTSARIVVSNWKYSRLYNLTVHHEILANQGGMVGLVPSISLYPPARKV